MTVMDNKTSQTKFTSLNHEIGELTHFLFIGTDKERDTLAWFKVNLLGGSLRILVSILSLLEIDPNFIYRTQL